MDSEQNTDKTAGDVLIDRVKTLLGIDTDYALEKRFNLRKSTVQQLRSKGGRTAPWLFLAAALDAAESREEPHANN